MRLLAETAVFIALLASVYLTVAFATSSVVLTQSGPIRWDRGWDTVLELVDQLVCQGVEPLSQCSPFQWAVTLGWFVGTLVVVGIWTWLEER